LRGPGRAAYRAAPEPHGRGKVAGVGINGRDTAYTYTVGFSNTKALGQVQRRSQASRTGP